MKKPNCYECKFRGTVPGSAHSSCSLIKSSGDEKAPLLEIMLASNQVSITDENTGELLVKFDDHGIRNGWAAWPLDFDPIWIEKCAFETPLNSI